MNSRCVLLPLSALLLSGCASLTGYLGRRPFAHGPYYHTWTRHSVPDSAVIAHLPIEFDVVAAELPPGGARMLEPLLSAMNGYLDHAGWSTRLDSVPSPQDEAPWAYVGTQSSLARVESARHFFAPDAPGDGSDLPGFDAKMVIQAKRPSKRWSAQLAVIAAAQHADYVLVISLGAAEYYPRSRRFPSLRMAVDLGTGNTVPVSWLTNSDVPVPVIHLMGLLLSRDGRVLRAGAEGLVVKEPNFLLSAFLHAQNPLTEGDVASLLASRHREDIEGQPLAWEVALRNLVRQLLGKP
jgi:hypothetical protein